jgi:uncharacterized protein YjbI with pentapeptide repeats
MTKQEALEHFIQNYAAAKNAAKIEQLQAYYQARRDELAADLRESLRRICEKIHQMQQSKEKGPIGYITYTLLRTNLVRGCYQYTVDAFTDAWIADPHECGAVYDVGWAYRFWEEFATELEEKRKLYIEKISKPELEKLQLREVEAYHDIVAALARYVMPEAVQMPEYQRIVKAEIVEIRIEDYRQFSEVVFREDLRVRDAQEIKRQLERKKTASFRDEIFCNLDLSHGNYQGISLNYADLTGSNLAGGNLRDCQLVGTKFIYGVLPDADLSATWLNETDFYGADLSRAVFHRAEGYQTVWVKANLREADLREIHIVNGDLSNADLTGADLSNGIFDETDFRGANLEGVNLTTADLSGSDLRNTILQGVNLQGAYLKKTRFNKRDAALLHLDATQRGMIVID